jgi:hypothetical protein
LVVGVFSLCTQTHARTHTLTLTYTHTHTHSKKNRYLVAITPPLVGMCVQAWTSMAEMQLAGNVLNAIDLAVGEKPMMDQYLWM